MSTFKLATIQDLSAANSSTPEQIAQGRAKAWITYNMVTTTSVFDSYNFTSVTDNGTGDATLNFTSALSNANYAVSGTGLMRSADAATHYISVSTSTTKTTSLVRIKSFNASGAVEDFAYVSVVIHGD